MGGTIHATVGVAQKAKSVAQATFLCIGAELIMRWCGGEESNLPGGTPGSGLNSFGLTPSLAWFSGHQAPQHRMLKHTLDFDVQLHRDLHCQTERLPTSVGRFVLAMISNIIADHVIGDIPGCR